MNLIMCNTLNVQFVFDECLSSMYLVIYIHITTMNRITIFEIIYFN
jgi:hypothetical protein